jgi:DNA-binding winged helix-turn-helix (wHTH) protein
MNHIAQMCANLIRSFEAMSGAAAYGKLKFGPFELSSRERVLRRDGVVLPLGDRALDILIYLAERPGEVVAKRELMDHVWSDVTVEEGSLRVHVAAIRKALGDGQSGNRYIANIKGRGYSFVGTVVSLAGSTESGNDRSGQPGRLPAQPRRMIGRDPVISEVSDKLRDERFVTLLGPGGIGKTTIALAVGRAAAEEFGGDPSSPTPMPTILRYGIAVLSVAIAIGLDFFLLRYFDAILTPFLFAVAATVWYAGTGPGVLAIVLSVLSLNYFFLDSFFSFSSISYADLVYLTFCTFCALAVGWVSAVRRRTEQELRLAHEELDAKISPF